MDTPKCFDPNLQYEPVDLSRLVCHVVAPMWYLSAFGAEGAMGAAPLCCPVCGQRVALDNTDHVSIFRKGCEGEWQIPCADAGEVRKAPTKSANPNTVVYIPLCCPSGHRCELRIGTEETGAGWAGAGVTMEESVYDLAPGAAEAKEKWG